jgi:hypothetical protein
MLRLLRSVLQSKKHGAGVVRARPPPQLLLAPAKFGAGKFCRLDQRKNKKSKGGHSKIIFF